jgi:hypothetical protein
MNMGASLMAGLRLRLRSSAQGIQEVKGRKPRPVAGAPHQGSGFPQLLGGMGAPVE